MGRSLAFHGCWRQSRTRTLRGGRGCGLQTFVPGNFIVTQLLERVKLRFLDLTRFFLYTHNSFNERYERSDR